MARSKFSLDSATAKLAAARRAKARRRAKGFKGELFQPIHYPHDVDLAAFVHPTTPEYWGNVEIAAERVLANAQDNKLALLARHYGLAQPVTAEEWKRLCLVLATDVIAGFEVVTSLTKPIRGTLGKQASVGGPDLVQAVDAHIEKKSCTIRQAVQHLSGREEPWKSHASTVASLQAQYSKEKHRPRRPASPDNMNAKLRKEIRILRNRESGVGVLLPLKSLVAE